MRRTTVGTARMRGRVGLRRCAIDSGTYRSAAATSDGSSSPRRALSSAELSALTPHVRRPKRTTLEGTSRGSRVVLEQDAVGVRSRCLGRHLDWARLCSRATQDHRRSLSRERVRQLLGKTKKGPPPQPREETARPNNSPGWKRVRPLKGVSGPSCLVSGLPAHHPPDASGKGSLVPGVPG
jgi:hypothetical protein